MSPIGGTQNAIADRPRPSAAAGQRARGAAAGRSPSTCCRVRERPSQIAIASSSQPIAFPGTRRAMHEPDDREREQRQHEDRGRRRSPCSTRCLQLGTVAAQQPERRSSITSRASASANNPHASIASGARGLSLRARSFLSASHRGCSENVTAPCMGLTLVAARVMLATCTPLRISLLGTPLVEVDGQPASRSIPARRRRSSPIWPSRATPQSRDVIATLLWPEFDIERSRAALRRTLSTLRTSLGGALRWSTDRSSIVARPLRTPGSTWPSSGGRPPTPRPTPAALAAAVDLHRGDLLAGFAVRGQRRLRRLAAARRPRASARERAAGARPARRCAGGGRAGRRGGGAGRAAARARSAARAGPPAADRALRGERPPRPTR